MKKRASFLIIPVILFAGYLGMEKSFAVAEEETQETPPKFYDVNKGDTYYVSISKLREWDIIEGYEDGTFKPSQRINRAEALKMITLSTGVFTEEEMEAEPEPSEEYEADPSEESAENDNNSESEEPVAEESIPPFPDTPLDAWYTKYLSAAKELEIIHGHPDGTFRPSDEINLAETLKILFESMLTQTELDMERTKEYLYEDTPEDAWFSTYTSYAGAIGIINIYPSNTVNPSQKMSRGYLAEVMYRAIMSQEGYEFGKATWYGGVFQGNTTASGEIFDKNELTAAHKYLPFNSVVEVTNLANGESVEVRITDRGPYGPGRVIDLSSEAFSRIASLGAGVINVQYKVVQHP